MIIYIATWEEWSKIQKRDEFISESYHNEGFIHCSYPHQTIWVLNKHFRTEEKVILLCIDPNLLESELISEDLNGYGEEFPHIYGKINTEAIVKTIDIHRSADGLFYENVELSNIV